MLNQQSQLDLTFQALADPTRRAIVECLARGPASVSDLARPVAMSMPAVLQHLAVLEGAGLVVSTKTGRVRTCRIERSALASVDTWLRGRRADWEQRRDRLRAYLDDLAQEQSGQNSEKED